ncbi:hypothetical protein ACFPJ1_06220 [Kribbella qitaiheensis]|uniref:hypothetical protein n=1 Tax=Kribbella qitaiheensis TaxID=1544730 RepID=UPI00360CDED1
MKLYRTSTVLVGVLFVLLGGLTRLATPERVYDSENREVVHGTIGETLKYRDSTITVHRMKVAKAYVDDDDKPVETNGAFVAVEYETVRGTEDVGSNDATLTTDDGTEYRPVAATIVNGADFAEPGFARSGSLVFEVNTADLNGLTLNFVTVQFWTVLTQDVSVDLGVPDEKVAQQLIDTAAPEYVIPKSVTRVA